ncbi:hypothetical protein BVC80_1767g30 [Macleaya cordata]|uniref:Uncharacterized protein n=1 Tax=Macleaya cordata TaxID=56857 RepID=A0A200QTC1_MACCD|nr:hypothetical protein BVC80_1767g30 [Macleaya cordata]
MLSTRSPIITRSDKIKQKTNRKPLQPKNFPANPTDDDLVKRKLKKQWIEISLTGNSNKENHPAIATTPANKQSHQIATPLTNKQGPDQIAKIPMKIESFDSSLAEELSVIRRKFERLRLEKEKTERMLRERDLVLETEMKRMENRGKAQRELEIQVERLQRLNDLRSFCIRASRIQSLREIEEAKKIKEAQLKNVKSEDEENEREKSEGSTVVDQMVEEQSTVLV